MQDHYLKKIDRVTAILTQLQSKPVVRAQDLANKFDVSIRTIYRDIKTLENAGIPIIGEAGTGYSLMEGYKLPPVMFTKEEVLGFITADKLMQNYSQNSLGTHYQTAIEKVKSVLRFSDRTMIQNVENQIDIYNVSPKEEDPVKNSLPIVLESIAEKKQLKIKYQDVQGDFSERNIEAVGIFLEFNYWYVMAYCTLRNGFRQFRIDRIQYLQKLEIPFHREYGSIQEYRNYSTKERVEVLLLVDKEVMPNIVNAKKYYGLIEEKETEKGVLLKFKTEWIENGFPRWILSFADSMEVVYPELLKENMQKLILNIQKRQGI